MTSAVFHASPEGQTASPESASAGPAPLPPVSSAPAAPVAPRPAPVPRDRLGPLRRAAAVVVPGAAGLGLLVLVWALLTAPGGSFPTPGATWEAAVKLFADPFYDNGPNDQGIGWNVLFSLERVALGFGLAALVGIPLGLWSSTPRSACRRCRRTT